MPTLPSCWQLTSRQDESWSRAAATEHFSNAISLNHLHGDHGSFAFPFAAARSRWGSKAQSQKHQLTCHQMCAGFQARLRFRCCSTCKVGTVSGCAFRVRGIAASFMCLGDKCAWVGSERSSKKSEKQSPKHEWAGEVMGEEEGESGSAGGGRRSCLLRC